MIATSNFSTSTGDEAGSAGGVALGLTKGKAEFVNYSFDVKFDGKGVPRLGDPMVHNKGGGPQHAAVSRGAAALRAHSDAGAGRSAPERAHRFQDPPHAGRRTPRQATVPAGPAETNGGLGVVATANAAGGAALAGAKVSLSGPTSLEGPTDAKGAATFPDLPPGAYTVSVEQPGFQTVTQSVTITSGADASLKFSLPPAKAGLTVAGVAEADKTTVGGLLVRRFDGNAAPRKKIALSLANAGETTNLLLQLGATRSRSTTRQTAATR